VAQAVLSKGSHGTVFSINWGFGIGVMMGVYISGGISGGHLNPAVTLALAITKKFPWRKVPAYFIGQYLGAFFASVVVYFVYWGKCQSCFNKVGHLLACQQRERGWEAQNFYSFFVMSQLYETKIP
jgi:glycerol uptake facilitator-like aquaporin